MRRLLRIVHIWFTIADKERFYGKKLVLRMYWDGETDPSVDTPLNDFFCEGHGLDYTVDSLPIRFTSYFHIAGRYQLDVVLTKSFDYGVYQATLDGKPVGRPLDLYSPAVVRSSSVDFGVHELPAGQHTLNFECKGRNSASAGCYFGLDTIELTPIPK